MTPERELEIAIAVIANNPLLEAKWLDPKLRFESGKSGWLK